MEVRGANSRVVFSLDPPFWWPARCLAVVRAAGGGESAFFGGVGVPGLFDGFVRGLSAGAAAALSVRWRRRVLEAR